MDSQEIPPFDQLLEDDTITILEHIIPFCTASSGKALALYVKFREISKIMTEFDNEEKLQACGFQPPPNDLEHLLLYLKNNVSPKKAAEINQLLQMLQFTKLYQSYSEMMGEEKEPTPSASMPELQSLTQDPAMLSKLQSMANHPAFVQMMREFLKPSP